MIGSIKCSTYSCDITLGTPDIYRTSYFITIIADVFAPNRHHTIYNLITYLPKIMRHMAGHRYPLAFQKAKSKKGPGSVDNPLFFLWGGEFAFSYV